MRNILLFLIMTIMAATAMAETTRSGRNRRGGPPPAYRTTCGGLENEILQGFQKSLQEDLANNCAYFRSASNCTKGGLAVNSCGGGSTGTKSCGKMGKDLIDRVKDPQKSRPLGLSKKELADQEMQRPDTDAEQFNHLRGEIYRKYQTREKRSQTLEDAVGSVYHDLSTKAQNAEQEIGKLNGPRLTALLRYQGKFDEYAKKNLSDPKYKSCIDALKKHGAPTDLTDLAGKVVPSVNVHRIGKACDVGLHTAQECKTLLADARYSAAVDAVTSVVPVGKIVAPIAKAAAPILAVGLIAASKKPAGIAATRGLAADSSHAGGLVIDLGQKSANLKPLRPGTRTQVAEEKIQSARNRKAKAEAKRDAALNKEVKISSRKEEFAQQYFANPTAFNGSRIKVAETFQGLDGWQGVTAAQRNTTVRRLNEVASQIEKNPGNWLTNFKKENVRNLQRKDAHGLYEVKVKGKGGTAYRVYFDVVKSRKGNGLRIIHGAPKDEQEKAIELARKLRDRL